MATSHCHHHRAALLLHFLTLLLLSSGDDSDVMLDLLSSLSPTPAGWSSSTPFCKWPNVACDSTSSFVTTINLDSASLSGHLPPSLNLLSRLQSLSVQRNSLSGPLPSFQNMSSLQSLYLGNNGFSSMPENFLLGLTNLQILSLNDNSNLQPWRIPSYLSESTSLVSIYASNASLTSDIPDIFASLTNLQNLRLSYNNLTGALPESFSGSVIQNLWLNNQKQGLSGEIAVLSEMTELYQVWLHANMFTGVIPDLSKCLNLLDLQLRDNRLTGVVPPSLTALPNLANVTLQNNNLQGPLPQFPVRVNATVGNTATNDFCLDTPGPCDPQVAALLDVAAALGYPPALAEAWRGNDACKSWKFVNCDSQGRNVTSVSMAEQEFSGGISPAFAKLTSLKNLVLSDNNLSGAIPIEINAAALPQLRVFDVSNNNLSGPIPVFPPSVKFLYGGNVLLGKSGGGATNSSGSSGRKGSDSSRNGLIAGVVAAAAVFIGVVLSVLYKYYVKKRMNVDNGGELKGRTTPDHPQLVPIFENRNVVFSIEELRQATNNFDEANELGRGGFGVVYRGELSNGTKVAVKRMEIEAIGTKGAKEFQAEINVLTNVRHKHLVEFHGYCINGSERLLVYECMPKGNLSQRLFGKQPDAEPLTWKQRLIIALDVARGVEYLHSMVKESYIHRDLKPSNILLSDDMRAKVADFGLVKSTPDGKYSIETRVAGTFGYLAPEYAATGRVTPKVDVYAFGVVLMEMITGRKALDETMSEEKSHLVTWFRRVLVNEDHLRNSVDRALELDDEAFGSICKVAELAGYCTALDPLQRPDMGHAVNILGPLVKQWRPSVLEEDEGTNVHISLPEAILRWQADEGASRMFDMSTSSNSVSQTQLSIPAKPMGFDSLSSTNCR